MEDKETIDQIKREHFIMRRALERIWLMHEKAMTENKPLQERVLWLDVSLAIKHTKTRTTQEMGIARIRGLDENKVMFKVGLINEKKMVKSIKNMFNSIDDSSLNGLPDVMSLFTKNMAVQLAKYQEDLIKGIFQHVTGEELTEINSNRVTIELLGRYCEISSSALTTHRDQYCIDGKPVLIIYPLKVDTTVASKFNASFNYEDLVRPVVIDKSGDGTKF